MIKIILEPQRSIQRSGFFDTIVLYEKTYQITLIMTFEKNTNYLGMTLDAKLWRKEYVKKKINELRI